MVHVGSTVPAETVAESAPALVGLPVRVDDADECVRPRIVEALGVVLPVLVSVDLEDQVLEALAVLDVAPLSASRSCRWR